MSVRLAAGKLVEQLRSRLEGAIKVPAGTLFRDVEAVTCSQYDNSSLVRSVIIQQHFGSSEGAAVFFFQYQAI